MDAIDPGWLGYDALAVPSDALAACRAEICASGPLLLAAWNDWCEHNEAALSDALDLAAAGDRQSLNDALELAILAAVQRLTEQAGEDERS